MDRYLGMESLRTNTYPLYPNACSVWVESRMLNIMCLLAKCKKEVWVELGLQSLIADAMWQDRSVITESYARLIRTRMESLLMNPY